MGTSLSDLLNDFIGGGGGVGGIFDTLYPDTANQRTVDEFLQEQFDRADQELNIGGDSIDPTFEELFQETLEAGLGPDPGATFRNAFPDIFGGTVNTPLDNFIASQFEELQDAYITFARTEAEKGNSPPPFERFIKFVTPSLKQRFKFTDEGILQGLDRFFGGLGAGDTPFNSFVLNRLPELSRKFIRIADAVEQAGGKPGSFFDFITELQPDLERRFGFTREGASRALDDILSLGNADSRFGQFVQQKFPTLFSRFQEEVEQTGGETGDFREFFRSNFGQIRSEFEGTRGGALESFQTLRNFSRDLGIQESVPEAQFIARNFERLFDEFSGAPVGERAGTFAEFISQNLPSIQQQASLVDPFERGQRRQEQLRTLSRIQ